MTVPALARSRVGQQIHRSFRPGTQVRADDATGGSGLDFSGYATVWDEPYDLHDWWGDTYQEVMRPGCFAKSLSDGADVRFLLNHEGIPLARTKSGTLTLTEDETGLLTECTLDGDSPLVQEIRSAMRRGDLAEMSLAFIVVREVWSPDFQQVDVTEARLIDVSVVTYPANPATSAGLRSLLVPEGMERREAARALATIRRSGDPAAAALGQQVADALGVTDTEAGPDAEPAEQNDPGAGDADPAPEGETAETPAPDPTSTGTEPEERQDRMSVRLAEAMKADRER